MAALLVLVGVVLVPDGFAWARVVATGLVALLLVMTAVLARRAVPSMAELIAGVAAQPLRARRAPGRARARR